ncbi:MAG TPA: iron ABC transporter permease [Candidatus Methylomirabilis sp.]|nr:iron ABC transporter permease [Candidatus Methylomirabilis sp.]
MSLRLSASIGKGMGWRPTTFALLLAILLLGLLLSVMVGSLPVAPREVGRALLGSGVRTDDPVVTVIRQIRLPRAVLAGIVGACLSLAGLGFQAISRNPLADPTVLGVSSGASFGVTLAVLLGLAGPFANPAVVTLFAFCGALLAAVAVYAIARVEGRLPITTLLLSGVVVGLFFNACVMLATALLASAELQGVVFWLMGNLGPARIRTLAVLALALLIGAAVLTRQAARLNLLALGEEQALQLGVEAERVKRLVFVAASLVTGAAVSAAGSIGFVGLIVPHAARLLLGPDNRRLVPATALLGASFLMLADLVARTVAAPSELPVGVITAFCGAPLFVYLLRTRRGGDPL